MAVLRMLLGQDRLLRQVWNNTAALAQRYRREAEDCRRNGQMTNNPVDQAAWRQLAADWMKKLARAVE
jgi:hypothetical protein